MKRAIVRVLAILVFLISIPYEVNAITYAKGVILDGQQIKMDVPPIIENGRTLVPMRGVLEAMGAIVNWDSSTKTATAFFAENSASVTIDKFTAYENGYAVTLDVPAKIVNGRTMVPLRFMAEAIGYDVSFIGGWVYLDTPVYDGLQDFDDIIEMFDLEEIQPELADEETVVITGYSEEDDAVFVSIESEGLAEALRVLANDKAYKSDWDEFIAYSVNLSKKIVLYFYENGYEVNGIVEIVDDEDNGYLILQIINGVITYNGAIE